ncbi:hypothetical protein EW145_g3842 [Phellinidium pouzarii]|uniref:Uncharacterized protein n=1 Tax=Phellinidium pouzarii TaxID=167371 RepID=A0A4S4LAV9_9AGAM|nr:hypothetical protein EW145_g3842 [Phellinidium pouzarii]
MTDPAAYPHFDLYPVRPGGLTSGDVRKHGLLSDTDDDKIVLPWNHVWPYQHVENAINPIVTRIDSGYPSIVPYPVAYPHFDLYPVKLKSSDATRGICIKDSIKYPIFSIYSAVNPAFEVYPGNVIEPQENSLNVLPVKLPSAYPSIEIYSPVYPHLVIYPAIVNSQFNSEWSCAQRFIHMSPIHLSPGYPWINIYSAVYPHFDLYPVRPHGFNKGDVLQRKSSLLYNMDTKKNISAMPRNYVCQHAQDSEDVDSPIFTRVNPGYSSIEPYPAAYPNFDLYHVKLESSGTTMGISIKVDVKYPNFDPATYPTFEIYPGYVIDPQENSLKAFPAKLPRTYPSIEIYPAVYPDFNIYPAMTNSVLRSKGMFNHISQDAGLSLVRQRDISVRLECFYPIFNLYPAMYPNNLEDIYPCVRSDHGEDSPLLAEVKLPTKYPYFNIYPATYPSFNFYPNIQKNAERYWEPSAKSKDTIVVTLKPKYPHIELYTPVYPHLSIYPAPPSPLSEQTVSVICETRYPNFDIYPAVYPFFDIYRTGNASMSEYWREPHPLKLIAKYPAFDNYPPVYPFFDIYNSGLTSDLVPLTKEALVRLEANYPVFDIYPAVYPHFQLYPAKQPVTQMTSSGFPDGHPVPANVSIYVQCRPHRTHKELHDLVFPNASASVATAGVKVAARRHRLRKGKALAGSATTPQQVESFRLTMNDLSEFPMPLMPALPELPNKQLGNSVNRPVAKLDRKKFPFH